MYEFKTYHPPDCPHQQGSETSGTGYEVKAKTFSAERLISADIEAERLELERAERAINPRDRAAIEWAVKRGADELRVHAPRVRFFEKSSKFDFDAVLYRTHPGEIWVSADKPWYKQVELALHETRHVWQLDGPKLSLESRESDASAYARSHQRWAHDAMRFVQSFS